MMNQAAMCRIDQMENEKDLKGEKGWHSKGFKSFSKNNKNRMKQEQSLVKHLNSEVETEKIWSFATAEKVRV